MFMFKVVVIAGLAMFGTLLASGIEPVVSRKVVMPQNAANMEKVSDGGSGEGKKPEESRVPGHAASETAAFEVGFHDGRTNSLKLKDEHMQLITPQGEKLRFRKDMIRRIDFAYATRLSDELRAQVDRAIADLGSEEFRRREKAVVDLRWLGGRAYAAILKASKNQDPEIASRAKGLLTNLRDQALDEVTFAELGQHDILYTSDSKFVGRIDADFLPMCTNSADSVQLKTADLDFLQSLSVDMAVKFVEKLGGQVVRDEKAMGRPVVAVRFAGTFRSSGATDKSLKELSRLSVPLATLQKLDFFICRQVTHAGLKELKKFQKLQEINFPAGRINDASLRVIKEIKALRKLNIKQCKITDAGLKELKELKELRSLNLQGCRQVTDAGLKILQEFQQLQELNIVRCGITDAGLKELKEFKTLNSLDIHARRLTDAAVMVIKELKGLRSLNLQGCGVTDAQLKELKELRELQSLSLDNCRQITDAGLKELRELHELQTLSLFDCRQITDTGLKELKELKKLRSLNLRQCLKITNVGLMELAELKNLQELNVLTTEEKTYADIAALRKVLPACRILYQLKPLMVWHGKVRNEKMIDEAPKNGSVADKKVDKKKRRKNLHVNGYITDEKVWRKLCEAWHLGGSDKKGTSLPDVDFEKRLVVFATWPCAGNRMSGSFSVDEKGDLQGGFGGTQMGGPGFACTIFVFDRAGIESYMGKKIEAGKMIKKD